MVDADSTVSIRENGMRADLAQPLADLKPSFFRFPGGNNLEWAELSSSNWPLLAAHMLIRGQTASQFWNWTKTIGPWVLAISINDEDLMSPIQLGRSPRSSRRLGWLVRWCNIWDSYSHNFFQGYYNTDGLGLLEYLYWCEDIGATPIMGVYAGYSLDGSSVPQSSLGPYIELAINQVGARYCFGARHRYLSSIIGSFRYWWRDYQPMGCVTS